MIQRTELLLLLLHASRISVESFVFHKNVVSIVRFCLLLNGSLLLRSVRFVEHVFRALFLVFFLRQNQQGFGMNQFPYYQFVTK